VQIASNSLASLAGEISCIEIWGGTSHDGTKRVVASEAGVSVVTLGIVGKPPPDPGLDVGSGDDRADVADAGVHSIEGCLVDQVDVDPVRLEALCLRPVPKAPLVVQAVPHRRRAKQGDEAALGLGV